MIESPEETDEIETGVLIVGTEHDHRRLLARLRDVMAGLGTGQQRLDKIVRLIATEMKAEVCSCYLMRSGDMLELFSTVGLNETAVHKTRLRVGEGVVGDIAARARSLADERASIDAAAAAAAQANSQASEVAIAANRERLDSLRAAALTSRRYYAARDREPAVPLPMPPVAEVVRAVVAEAGGGWCRRGRRRWLCALQAVDAVEQVVCGRHDGAGDS